MFILNVCKQEEEEREKDQETITSMFIKWEGHGFSDNPFWTQFFLHRIKF